MMLLKRRGVCAVALARFPVLWSELSKRDKTHGARL